MNIFEKNMHYFTYKKSRLNLQFISEAPEYELLHINEGQSEFIQKEDQVYEVKYEVDVNNLPNHKIRQLYFILGITNINELYQLFQSAHPKTIFYIIEPQPGFLKYICSQFDFTLFEQYDIRIFCDELIELPNFLEEVFRTEDVLLIRNIKIYGDFYYRNFEVERYGSFVNMVTTSVKHNLFKFGNSIEDSLIGLANNTYNMRFLSRSLDFVKMKDLFAGKPAIIVAAGPSLEKNIHQIKAAQHTSVICAVDTIAERLIREGIVPHFIFAIERVHEVYDYFFKGKHYPEEITLVVPPVVRPEILEEFEGNIVLPFRENIHEYHWFNRMYNFPEEVYMPMGLSVAHLAFGFAVHLGCSPIILTGQDLAHGEKSTHVSGTVYDEKSVEDSFSDYFETEGYNGEKVKTTQIWLDFKQLFELEINKHKLNVIDATEGGARILHTTQMTLKEAAEKYCNETLAVNNKIATIKRYEVNQQLVDNRYKEELTVLKEISDHARSLLSMLKLINVNKYTSSKHLKQALDKMKKTDSLLQTAMKHPLYMHNLQSYFIQAFKKFNSITNEFTFENVRKNLDIQLELAETISSVGDLIIKTIELNQQLTRDDLYEELEDK
ncbi:motility associated factor glycosyltransferase family protein [Sporosarcina soli]|uniref:Motility associated factor glycosyltransferase family protein n=1 Tax=Sporosarcina soli TaxID=334736 RepID=A0ABW0TH43_9BACL